MTVAPSGTSAWRALLSDIVRPRRSKSARMASSTTSSRRRGTFITVAIASRVMSSWVGPSPPQAITASLLARALRNARTMRSRLSPTLVWKWQSMPEAASSSPMCDELVSTIWPSSSSVPTATTSTRMDETPRPARLRRTPGLPASRAAGVVGAREPGVEGECDRHPQQVPHEAGVVGADGRQQGEAHHDVLHEGLQLGARPGRHRDPPPSGADAVGAHGELPEGDERDRQPADLADFGERGEHAEHKDLVGERVEEGARGGGALTAGEEAVDPVAPGAHQPERGEQPGRGAGEDDERDEDGRGEQPEDREHVGRGEKGARPEGGPLVP